MAVRLRRVNPLEYREPIVDFFWRQRAWPYPSREDYQRYWQWRYSSISEGEPTAWIAEDADRVVGHIGCFFRQMRLAGSTLRVAVPGNLLVEPEFRSGLVGPQIGGSPLKLLRSEEADIVLSYSNQAAHAVLMGLGCRELGTLHSYIQIRRWAPLLRRRLPGGGAAAPLVSAAVGAWNWLRGRRRPQVDSALAIRELTEARLRGLDRSHWQATRDFVWNPAPDYLADRFMNCPTETYRLIEIFDQRSARCEGIVIGQGTSRFYILQCQVNPARLNEAEAAQLLIDSSPHMDTALAPLLPGTALADQFTRAGYFDYGHERPDSVLARTTWSALWKKGHRLSDGFGDLRRWALWYTWNHH
jgi:hypothetical protein